MCRKVRYDQLFSDLSRDGQDCLIEGILSRLEDLEASVTQDAQRTTDLEDAGEKVALDNSTLSQALAESNRSVEELLTIERNEDYVMVSTERYKELLDKEWKYDDLANS